LPLEMPEDELKKRFPHIAKEIEEQPSEETASIKVRANPSGYQPNVMDFLARCDNNKQALEIIDYLEKRGELPQTDASALRLRISEHGVRSVAKKRKPGHYFREFGV
jgi:hypothetical protein